MKILYSVMALVAIGFLAMTQITPATAGDFAVHQFGAVSFLDDSGFPADPAVVPNYDSDAVSAIIQLAEAGDVCLLVPEPSEPGSNGIIDSADTLTFTAPGGGGLDVELVDGCNS